MEIKYISLMFGADPEFFFTQKGKVIGAEKMLPKAGVADVGYDGKLLKPVIIIDGVQAEFNPPANRCRESFSGNIRYCFRKLNETIKDKKVEVDFAAGVAVDEEELASLDEENQKFGCSPSENAYRESKIQVQDASQYHYRSAGGHVHLGCEEVKKDPRHTVMILDILLGNTCVLFDRDPGNVERRKNYGRAGEYRLPAHGLEYRTLSNFWLRHYVLMSFVLGVARFAVALANDTAASKKLLELVDMKKIEKAINENDYDLAYENFNKIKGFLSAITFDADYTDEWTEKSVHLSPFYDKRIAAIEKIAEKGITHYFPQDPMAYWLTHTTGTGWERFADSI